MAPDAAQVAVIWIAREAVGALVWVIKRRRETTNGSGSSDRVKADVDRLLKWKHDVASDHEKVAILWKKFMKDQGLD